MIIFVIFYPFYSLSLFLATVAQSVQAFVRNLQTLLVQPVPYSAYGDNHEHYQTQALVRYLFRKLID
jgi:hypothetical protein